MLEMIAGDVSVKKEDSKKLPSWCTALRQVRKLVGLSKDYKRSPEVFFWKNTAYIRPLRITRIKSPP